ncbi:MAG: biotin--[acetyl-CoA-carboxylase] ligase [Chthoniobacterales bacterium]|nr:biotin--[acetyl-CoA-carboxylase] ligase [Chthoniobacterales bacterium]
MSEPDPLDAVRLRSAVRKQRIGRRVVVLEETTSTNDKLAEMAAESAEGLVVLAEHQTSGRGQYGRHWESAARKGLWMSILLRPQLAVAESRRLTAFFATVIAATIEKQLRLVPAIKSPNDVYLDGRKIAGVLVEMRVESRGSYCAIAGLGINVNQTLTDFPTELRETAGSLSLARGSSVDRTELAIELLRRMEERYTAGQL